MKCALTGCKKHTGPQGVVITVNKVSRTFCDKGHALIFLADAEWQRLMRVAVSQIPASWTALERAVIGTAHLDVVLSSEESAIYKATESISCRYFDSLSSAELAS